MRVSTSMIPPCSGTVPAHRLEPAPRGTTGTREAVARRRTAATCSVFAGNTTASGGAENSGVASRAYGATSPDVERTCTAPTTLSSSASTAGARAMTCPLVGGRELLELHHTPRRAARSGQASRAAWTR